MGLCYEFVLWVCVKGRQFLLKDCVTVKGLC